MMSGLNLAYGLWTGKEVKTLHPRKEYMVAPGCEYFPLTAEENQFIADDTMGLQNAWGLLGYSVLYEGRKYAAPAFEVTFFNPTVHREDERHEYFENADKARAYVTGMADLIEAVFAANNIDGHVLITEFDGMEDRHTLAIMLPFDFLANTFPGYNEYKKWLVDTVLRYDETYDVPKIASA